MLAHDLGHSRIEYLKNCINFSKKKQSDTRRKRLRCASDTTNHQSTIENHQSGCPINRDFRFASTGFAGLG